MDAPHPSAILASPHANRHANAPARASTTATPKVYLHDISHRSFRQKGPHNSTLLRAAELQRRVPAPQEEVPGRRQLPRRRVYAGLRDRRREVVSDTG